MKKILYIAAAVAATVACSKNIETTTQEIDNPNAFVKGQKVTLTVGTGNQTKVSSELVTTGEDKDKVNFKWETEDKILVKVGEASAEFTLKSGAGEAKATFEGTMPAAGDNFDVQYPLTDPDLSTQTYSASEAIPHDKMKFTASGCTVSKDFNMTAVNAALRLNLYGSTAIGSIVVTTNEGTPKTYTLDCMSTGSGTEPSKTDKPKHFFIVVPAGTYGFTVSVKDASDAELYSVSTTVGQDKKFTANEILSMKPLGYPGTDAQPVAITTGTAPSTTTVVWAPVNCGYDADHTYGLLYQWGRTVGGTYDAAWTAPSSHAAETQTQAAVAATWDVNGYNKSPKSNEFYMNSSSPYDWYTNDASKQLTEWPMTAPTGTSGIGNPCPTGWRVPTKSEFDKLMGGDGTGTSSLGNSGWDSTNKGYWFNGTSSPESGKGLFLPAAGYRLYDNGSAIGRGGDGYYWSSSVNDDNAWGLNFADFDAFMYDDYRAVGYSVRCVQE